MKKQKFSLWAGWHEKAREKVMLWKLLIIFLKCNRKPYLKAIKYRGETYLVSIEKYKSTKEQIDEWTRMAMADGRTNGQPSLKELTREEIMEKVKNGEMISF